MAKSNLERTLEKQQREAKRQAARDQLQQKASAIVAGQPLVGGLRIMDSAAEELLKVILSLYRENDNRKVTGKDEDIPPSYLHSLNLEFEKLEMYGMIVNSVVFPGIWYTTLNPQAFTYFEDKETALKINRSPSQTASVHSPKQYDLFLSHANKDKLDYVNDLYIELRRLRLNIFYDSDVLSWGDLWKEVILRGTEESEFAIIVISENFFGREWTEKELQQFLSRQNSSGQKIVLPLLHDISIDQLKEHYPALADIQVIDTSTYSTEEITILFAKEFIKRLRGFLR